MNRFHSEYGDIDLKKAKIGSYLKSATGEVLAVVEPAITDMLRKCRRGPQIITPKDAACIIAMTGLSNGWHCLDAGSGSGFLSLFLGNVVKPDGTIVTYERNKEFYQNVVKNIRFCGMEKIIKAKNKDILKGFTEKNLDIITLDMEHAEKLASKAHKALKPGGWLVVYSPHIEQQKKCVKEMKKTGFVFVSTIENIQRHWQVNNHKGGFSHPKYSDMMHTGFMSFGRKI